MKIKVRLSASQSSSSETFDLSDFDLTVKEWNELSDEEKREKIQNAVIDLPEHPYWVADSFTEENKQP